MKWPDGKPYYSLNQYYREIFGEKTYKLALDIGTTCPNRDGTLSNKGCIYCSENGSGDYATGLDMNINAQIGSAIDLVSDKYHGNSYIAYLQSFTNTYGPTDELLALYMKILDDPRVKGLAIGTRPDCLADDLIRGIGLLSKRKPIWIELGLQTIHENSAYYINRCYKLPVFEDAVNRLSKEGIPTIVHLIAGLPTEDHESFIKSIKYLNTLPISGIKIHLLHVLRGTVLGTKYNSEPFELPDLEAYVHMVTEAIGWLSPQITLHRLTGDAPKPLLIAPLWSLNKRKTLNTIHKTLKEKNIWQGKYLNKTLEPYPTHQEAFNDRQ